ncbi:MAG: hypothetical protein C0594_03470 [Marinilabiliales bacterium]|nr:MAG: hypothetical protein C0594_03470 [Marinilabiliales bacterium]
MRKTLQFLLIAVLISAFGHLKAQNVAITDDAGYNADASAMLDVKSTNKGMLIPRLTTAQRENINNPVAGLLVYDSTENAFYYYDGQSWLNLTSGTTGPLWVKSGSRVFLNDTTDNVGIGTKIPKGMLEVKADNNISDEDPIFGVVNKNGDTVLAVYNSGVRINVENDPAKASGNRGGFAVGGFSQAKSLQDDYLWVTPDSVRIYIPDSIGTKASGNRGGFAVGGFSVAKNMTNDYLFVHTDSTRVYVEDSLGGFGVGSINTDNIENLVDLTSENYFIGHHSGDRVTSGIHNQFIGYQAGFSDTSGSFNSFIGYQSGYSNVGGPSSDDGVRNSFMGFMTGYHNTIGRENTFIGSMAGYGNTTGDYNTVVGADAGINLDGAKQNTLIGAEAGNHLAAGYGNVFVGVTCGFYADDCSYNTIVGNLAGQRISTGEHNTSLGYLSGYYNQTGNNNTFLGDMAGYFTQSDNNVMIGKSAGQGNFSGEGNVFIGYNAGYNETESNKLYIENSDNDDETALIYGEFDYNKLRFNASVGISTAPSGAKLRIQQTSSQFFNTTSGGIIIQDGNSNTGNFWEALSYDGNTTKAKLDDNANLTIAGYANLKSSSTGVAMYVNGDEALWYNDTYFSWGYGGAYNYFADEVGIATSSPSYTLEVNGSAGKPGGGSWSNSSDIRLKDINGDYSKGLEDICKLNPVQFNYKKNNPRHLPSDIQYVGFIAQDVQKVFPEAVNKGEDGYLDFNMHSINVALVNAVKELKKENEELKRALNEQEKSFRAEIDKIHETLNASTLNKE